tara:strand:- start:21 stop:161 length:141 start_codon:yes stop_codon:yes gene_type:complete
MKVNVEIVNIEEYREILRKSADLVADMNFQVLLMMRDLLRARPEGY